MKIAHKIKVLLMDRKVLKHLLLIMYWWAKISISTRHHHQSSLTIPSFHLMLIFRNRKRVKNKHSRTVITESLHYRKMVPQTFMILFKILKSQWIPILIMMDATDSKMKTSWEALHSTLVTIKKINSSSSNIVTTIFIKMKLRKLKYAVD